MVYDKERKVALRAVTVAAQLCEGVRQLKDSQALEKPDASPVTVADFGSQAVICQVLAAAFPEDPVIAEEDASLLQKLELAYSLAQVADRVGQFIPGAT